MNDKTESPEEPQTATPPPEQDEPTQLEEPPQHHPCTRRRTSTGAQFSSTHCPTPETSTCDIPFGFVFSPMSLPTNFPVIEEEDPILCVTCLSYLNMYSEWNEEGLIWRCAICGGCTNVVSAKGVRDEYLSGPVLEFRRQVAPLENECEECCIFIIDGNLHCDEIKTIRDTFHSVTQTNTICGVLSFTGTVNVYQVGLSGIASADVHIPSPSRRRLDDRAYLGQSHHVWNILTAIAGENRSDGEISSRREQLRKKLERRGRSHARKKKEKRRCTGTAISIAVELAMLSGCSTTRICLFTNGCPNVGMGSVVRDTSERRRFRDVVDPDALQMAIEYYSGIANEAFASGVGFDVFCSGTTSLGLPAWLALVQPSSGYALLHTSLSSPQFGANLQHVFTHTHFTRSLLTSDLDMNGCVVDIRMSSFLQPIRVSGPATPIYEPAPHPLSISTVLSLERASFASCAAHSASFNFPTHNLPSKPLLAATTTRMLLGRYDPLSTISAILQFTANPGDDDQPYAYFQFISRFLSRDRTVLHTRVYTHRLPLASDIHDFLHGVDEEVVPILLGREATLRAFSWNMDNVQQEQLADVGLRDLDVTVHRISKQFRNISSHDNPDIFSTQANLMTQSSIDFAFPPELCSSLHLLHHLRRGPILNPSLMSTEDRASLINLFLRLPLQDCISIMAPSLQSIRVHSDSFDDNNNQPQPFIPVPPETLVLWDNVIIAADHFDSLFIWSGRLVTSPPYDPLREQCQSLLTTQTQHRFPAPTLYICTENDSMSRRFTCRLLPSHMDPPEQQLAHFPDLALLSPQEMMTLRGKFRFFTGGETFRKWFWSVASAAASGANKMDGNSLCE